MNSKLVFDEKLLVSDDGYGYTGITSNRYSNDVYTVYILDNEGEFEKVNIVNKDFHAPTISLAYGINIAATGSLSLNELATHIEALNLAKETLEQVIQLVNNFNQK